jgi:hypothetical protein
MEGKDVGRSGSKAIAAPTSPTTQSSAQSDRTGDAHEELSDTPPSAISGGDATVDDVEDGDDAAVSNDADAAPFAVPGSTTPAVKVRRKPVPRKGHTKSRKGCLSCKRRRVKCPETLPECDNCRRLGLSCHYPKGNEGPRFSVSSSSSASSSSPKMTETHRRMGPVAAAAAMLGATFTTGKPARPISVLPTSFSVDDMRFFQHFLCTAYPPLPIEGNDVWKEVAAISHDVSTIFPLLSCSSTTLCRGAPSLCKCTRSY